VPLTTNRPQSYLVLYNVMKPRNVGYLLRTAAACGVSEVIVVGRRSMYADRTRGTALQLPRRHFFKLPQAFEHLRSIGTTICGVEIADAATPVHTHPFRGSTAFFFGNEITGLTPEQQALCDHLVYIPQFGAAHSLNVNVSAGIVLHHFAIWAGLEERMRAGGKFVVDSFQPPGVSPRF
jgi:23S rRNA (guanosine2251-2'-O)-methyltransferase